MKWIFVAICTVFVSLSFPSVEAADPETAAVSFSPTLWESPGDISSRDLFDGPSTEKPAGPFVFLEEDIGGTNPKFIVRDRNGTEWKVKLGLEARTEVAASRLLWAAGYFTGEYHFFPTLQVENVARLKRGERFRGPDGVFYGARLKREPEREKIGTWKWEENPFLGTREFNGLRIMMGLVNNWDLKAENNAIFPSSSSKGTALYMVSDLGATFGASNWIRPTDHSKGNLAYFIESKFIRRIEDHHVHLKIGNRPSIINAVNLPLFLNYVRMGWIGKKIPREHARWMGILLSGLSRQQIKDAFRAAGYGPHEVEGFSTVVVSRIAALKDL